MCEIKSGLMKGRVRLSELAGRREVNRKRESGGEVCMGKECWVGKEGRHAGLCAKSKEGEMERLREGERAQLCLGFIHRGGTGERAQAQKPRPARSRVAFEG